MIESNKNYLFKLASVFRRAIIESDSKDLSICLQNFPTGACSDASLLLAKYLENNQCGKFQYVLGNRNGHSHAWIEQGPVIIDITADQFQDQNRPVIVTSNRAWHSQFCGDILNEANYEIYDSNTTHTLETDYKRITSNIKNI